MHNVFLRSQCGFFSSQNWVHHLSVVILWDSQLKKESNKSQIFLEEISLRGVGRGRKLCVNFCFSFAMKIWKDRKSLLTLRPRWTFFFCQTDFFSPFFLIKSWPRFYIAVLLNFRPWSQIFWRWKMIVRGESSAINEIDVVARKMSFVIY